MRPDIAAIILESCHPHQKGYKQAEVSADVMVVLEAEFEFEGPTACVQAGAEPLTRSAISHSPGSSRLTLTSPLPLVVARYLDDKLIDELLDCALHGCLLGGILAQALLVTLKTT